MYERLEDKDRKWLSKHRSGPKPKPIADRFWPKVAKGGPDECWVWNGAMNGNGYGCFWLHGRYESAHRVSYMMTYGDIANGKVICHRCDNPVCVNPRHLFIGTPRDNSIDRSQKLRGAIGEKNSGAKLTESDVHEIRQLSGNVGEIAKAWGVSRDAIYRIWRRVSWKHI